MRYIIQRFPFLLALPLLLAGMMAGGCNDDPSTIGSSYLPQNVLFQTYTLKPGDFQILSAESAASNSTAEGGLSLLVGKAAHGTVAHGLLAITTESPVVSGAGSRPVVSASFTLRPINYRYGDTSSHHLKFDLVVLDEVFASNTKWSPGLVSRIMTAPSLGTCNVPTYTDSTPLTFSLDPAATQKFLQEYFRYDSTQSGNQVIREFRTLKTLALRATDSTGLIAGFLGAVGGTDSLLPTLTVNTADTTILLRAGTSSWIATSDVPTTTGKVILNAGVPVRSLVRLNIDSIPAGATIHQAELVMHVDEANSFYGTSGVTNYLVGYIGVDSSTAPGSYLKSGIGRIVTGNRNTLDSTHFGNTFTFTGLGPVITSWLLNRRQPTLGYPNNGLILAYNRSGTKSYLETTTVDRITFYGPDAADPALRPSLIIIYSMQADAK
jgi:hypothetical protein